MLSFETNKSINDRYVFYVSMQKGSSEDVVTIAVITINLKKVDEGSKESLLLGTDYHKIPH